MPTLSKYNKKTNPMGSASIRLTWVIGTALIVASIIVSVLYLFHSWNRISNAAESEAVTLAQSLETLIDSEHIANLSGGAEDLEKPEYIITKRHLSQLVETTNAIDFAYLMGIKDGNIIFLLDSESPDSSGYSAPGQIYTEADESTWEAFRTGKTILSGPSTDRWGTWISVLVPVTNPSSGQIIAVFGINFSASEWFLSLWKQMIPEIIISLLIIILIIALSRAAYQYFKLKVLNDKAAIDEALYRSVFEQAPVGIAIVNDKKFVSQSKFGSANMNSMFEKILGRTSIELADIDWGDITHPDDLQADLEQFEKFKAGEVDGYAIAKRFLKPDGAYVWTYMKIAHFLGWLRDSPMHLCLLDDISMEKETADSLHESERSKSVLLSNLPGMAYRCSYDRDWTMKFISDGCKALTGYAPENLVNNKDIHYNDIIAPEYREAIWKEWIHVIANRVPFKYEYEIVTANGERKWVLEMAQGIYDEHGVVEALEGIIFDISDRKEIENSLKYAYEHDSDTGLYNVNSFLNLLINDEEKKTDYKKAIIQINLSTVQRLNMAYGFNYARDLIKQIAKILDRYTTENCMLFKTYETRFVYYMKGYSNQNELLEFSRKIKDALWEVLKVERIGAGIGILEVDDAEEFDLSKITKRALISSFKATGLDENQIGICLYDNAMEAQIQREEDIMRELTKIVEKDDDGQLYLQFQPIVDLTADRISSFEALARLKTNKLGFISPLEFIPIAEITKLIIPIGWEIIRQALDFLKKLGSIGYNTIGVGINISAIQLLENGFIKRLYDMIDEMQVSPSNIDIELTESIFASDLTEINKIMAELRDHGIKILIDDFGTGYSSLARERELKADCLKIDKYFIDRLLDTPYGETITSDIIAIAHKRGQYVIAEGVEFEEQRQYLLDNRCDKIQGYLISKPLDEEAAIELLRKQLI